MINFAHDWEVNPVSAHWYRGDSLKWLSILPIETASFIDVVDQPETYADSVLFH
jgi:hypothetical protein